jgi:acetyl esterase/lipase
MKNTLLFFYIALLFSCKKETSTAGQALAAQTLTNISYGSDAEQKMDLYLPAARNTTDTKLIILIHGGAWVTGDKADFATYIPILQQKLPGYAIANINYHLATTTTNHFPTQENDLKAAIDFLIHQTSEYYISQKIVLLGASAGGHLAELQEYKYATPKIKAVVDFYGPVDMVETYNDLAVPFYKTVVETLMSGTPALNPDLYQQSSPLNFVTAQSPPSIIFHGDADELVNVSQSVALKNKLQGAGIATQLVIYPNLGHDIWPDSIMNDAFTKIETFLKTNVQ